MAEGVAVGRVVERGECQRERRWSGRDWERGGSGTVVEETRAVSDRECVLGGRRELELGRLARGCGGRRAAPAAAPDGRSGFVRDWASGTELSEDLLELLRARMIACCLCAPCVGGEMQRTNPFFSPFLALAGQCAKRPARPMQKRQSSYPQKGLGPARIVQLSPSCWPGRG